MFIDHLPLPAFAIDGQGAIKLVAKGWQDRTRRTFNRRALSLLAAIASMPTIAQSQEEAKCSQ
ncbi:hypothetical protein D3227_31810 [Mesorhizobium waimense]|uniref:Uncharacterized protein n=1 Tax=Mesorhizobium waimense TaxID=1300307 RepID=A0A3A5KF74_9HYPH|nr:hypothetical protein D3227_31810 [Mesorhizobium waimense]